MFKSADSHRQSALMALEATVSSAREGFACMFSTSDEYERALISVRREQGRYRSPSRIPVIAFVGLVLMLAVVALFLIKSHV